MGEKVPIPNAQQAEEKIRLDDAENGLLAWDREILKAQMKEKDKALKVANERAETDPVTTLLNQHGFEARLAHAYARYKRGEPFSVITADLNGLKLINDTYGHDAGNRALRAVAQALVGAVRKVDAVARTGGDEFHILLEGGAEAGPVIEKCRAAIAAARFELNNVPLPLSASFGGAAIEEGEEPDVPLKRADEAMYADKRQYYESLRGHSGEEKS